MNTGLSFWKTKSQRKNPRKRILTQDTSSWDHWQKKIPSPTANVAAMRHQASISSFHYFFKKKTTTKKPHFWNRWTRPSEFPFSMQRVQPHSPISTSKISPRVGAVSKPQLQKMLVFATIRSNSRYFHHTTTLVDCQFRRIESIATKATPTSCTLSW